MTVVTAVVTPRYIAVASDSLLTYKQSDGTYKPAEDRVTKIFRVDAYPAAITFLGTTRVDGWSVLDFLERSAANARTLSSSLGGFTEHIRSELNNRIGGREIGLGVHIAGYEVVNNIRIPEVFFVTNYKNMNYDVQPDVKNGRHTYKQMFGTEPDFDNDGKTDRRLDFKKHLDEQPLAALSFFHGDPELLPVYVHAHSLARKHAKAKGWLKQADDIDLARSFAVEPVRALINFQGDICRPEYKTVGAPIHDLVFDASGAFTSASGD